MRFRARTMAIVALIALTISGPASGLTEKILFSSNRGGSFDIWMMDPDGSNVEVLVASDANLFGPRVSPDGKEVAVAAFLDGQHSYRVLHLKTGQVDVFPVPFAASRFDWDPSSDALWTAGLTTNVQACITDIDILDLSTGGFTKVINDGRRDVMMAVDWRSGEVYYHADPCWSPSNVLKAYDPALGSTRIVRNRDGRAGEDHGDVHPDGALLVYSRSLVSFIDPRRIFLWPADGSGPEIRLSSNTGLSDREPEFSVDGEWIVFQRRMPGNDWDLWVVSRDGTVETSLLDTDYREIHPNWELLDLCSYAPPEQPLRFERFRGKPEVETSTWTSCGGPGVMVLEPDHVSSAFVYLNGNLVAGPSQFNPRVESLEFDVELVEGENVLQVELRGKPGSTLDVQFEE